MLPSVCSIRSAQCAALIALATIAGISRFEPSSEPEPASNQSHPSVTRTTPLHRSSSRPSALLAQLARLYLEHFFLASPRACTVAGDLAAPTSATPPLYANHPTACVTPAHAANHTADAFAFSRPPDCVSAAVRPHCFPFAVGPPPPHATPPHRAAGTSVPQDVTARWSFVSPVVPASLFSVARLACTQFSGQLLAAPNFPPSSALRGEPAALPTSVRFRPSLGVARLRDADLFSFST